MTNRQAPSAVINTGAADRRVQAARPACKSGFGKIIVMILALVAAAPVSAAIAETTAKTVTADTAACVQSRDKVACEAVYDYLAAAMEVAKGKKAEKFLPDMRIVADTGCSAGNGWLCTEIGRSHKTGERGRAEDQTLALKYHLQACDLDFGLGCARAGLAYELGKGTVTDRAQATELYQKGCRLGSSNGCQYEADLLMWDRINTEPAAPEPIETLKGRCADTGLDGPSCLAIGVAYFRGTDGVEQDEAEAGKYFGKACGRAIYPPGCFYLGMRKIRTPT